MGCTKLRDERPFFAGEEGGSACEGREGWRTSLMTGREGAVAAICALVGVAAGGQTDGWLGGLVGAFVCGCLGALGAMMMPEQKMPETGVRDEAVRARIQGAVQGR